jgi:transcriptional regulator with XRE-family HTH domain
MSSEDDVQRVLSLLKRAIRSSGSSQKEVDRKIGVQPGYLSQVMIGRLDLKLKHLLRALEAIEVDPAGFFSLAFPVERGEATGGDLLRLLPAPGSEPRRPPAPSATGSIADQELERLVAQALAEELGLPVGELRPTSSMR